MKVNAKDAPNRGSSVMVDVGRGKSSARDALAQEDRVARNIRGAGRLTSRGGPSPEKCEGERRR